jgi:hypothetical protein
MRGTMESNHNFCKSWSVRIFSTACLGVMMLGCSISDKQSALVFQSSTNTGATDPSRGVASVTNDSAAPVSAAIPVADRAYVSAALLQAFSNGQDTTAIQSIINNNIYVSAQFGGGCDHYAASNVASAVTGFPGTLEYPAAKCVDATVLPAYSNPMRYANTATACDSIVNSSVWTTSSGQIMNKIISGLVAGAVYPTPNATTVKKAYAIFFPIDPPSTDVVNALLAVGTNSTNTTDAWKQIVIAICSSPEWQVL